MSYRFKKSIISNVGPLGPDRLRFQVSLSDTKSEKKIVPTSLYSLPTFLLFTDKVNRYTLTR